MQAVHLLPSQYKTDRDIASWVRKLEEEEKQAAPAGMVDPVATPLSTLRLIFDIIIAIRDTADDVRCNKEDWETIKSHSAILEQNLLRLQDNEELMKDLAVGLAVANLSKTFSEAEKLLDKCKVQRNIICVWWVASRLSKKFSRMKSSIEGANSSLGTTLVVYNACLPKPSVHPPAHEPVAVPSSAPGGEMAKQTSSMVREIVYTSIQINTLIETVRRNKWECFEVDKRAGKVSAFLLRLESNADMMKDPALNAVLKELVKTFHRAHELVTACQRRNLVPSACHGGYGSRKDDRELSKELHQVLDQMVLDLNGMTTEITMHCTRVQFTATLMASRFVTKLRLARQRSKGIPLHSIGHLKEETSQLDASFEVKEFQQAHAEEIDEFSSKKEIDEFEAVASES